MKWIKATLLGMGIMIFYIFLFWFGIVKDPNSILPKTIKDSYFMGVYIGGLELFTGFGIFLEAAKLKINFVSRDDE
jgi:hypothetical protein